MSEFTKGQKIIYWRLRTQLHPEAQIQATYCGPYNIGKWQRHHISFTENGCLVHRYVSSAAIRASETVNAFPSL